ncbi:MAG TPA: hypothetical protein VIF60_17875 [Burkholderiaceae bacterium]|jgi:hypothetical protein
MIRNRRGVYLYLGQKTPDGVHGGFPRLRGAHFHSRIVALHGDTAAPKMTLPDKALCVQRPSFMAKSD